METSKSITIALLVVKVVRILLTIAFAMVFIFSLMQIFLPNKTFTISFPVSFIVYEIDQESVGNSSFHAIDVSPGGVRIGEKSNSKSVIEKANGNIQLRNVSKNLAFGFLFFGVLFFVLLLYIFSLLKQFLIAVEKGTPFIEENVKRFRVFGIITIIFALLAGLIKFIAGFYVSSSVTLPSNLAVVHSFNLHWEIIFLGIILFVIAEVFKIGDRVKAENDLTV